MRIALVDGPTALALLNELIPCTQTGGVNIHVAWVRPNRLIQTVVNCADRIGLLRYGTSFSRSDPDTLAQFLNAGIHCQHVRPPSPQVFHPKEYFLLGKDGKWAAALVGSSNLTSGGLGGIDQYPGNLESSLFYFIGEEEPGMAQTKSVLESSFNLAVMHASDSRAPVLSPIKQWCSQFQEKYDAHSERLDQKGLDRYRKQFKDAQKVRLLEKEALQRTKIQSLATKLNPANPLEAGWLCSLSWKDYRDLLMTFPEELDERVAMLDTTRELLNGANNAFTAIPQLDDRLAIAGVRNRRNNTSDPLNWHLFGDMSRNPAEFIQMIQQPDQKWAQHVNRLSNLQESPELSDEQAWEIMQGLTQQWIQIGRVTRLMAMMRPSEYLPVTNKNKNKLLIALGLPECRSITPRQYQETVLQKLSNTPWYNQQPKRNWDAKELTIWRYRMALVDMLVYT